MAGKKPCGCGKAQSEASNAANDLTKPEIVPFPPELRERNRAQRPDVQELIPDYLTDVLVPVPEGAEPENE